MLLSLILQLVPVATLYAFAIPLAMTDLREHRLPNKFTFGLLIISAMSLLFAALLIGKLDRYFLALAVSLLILLLGYGLSSIALIGYGDIKLIAGMSLILFWFEPVLLPFALFVAFGLASLSCAIGLVFKRIDFRSSIALGPYLLLGFGFVSLFPAMELVLGATEAA